MSDTTVSTETPATEPEATPPAGSPTATAPEGAEGKQTEGETPDPLAELPPWARKEITKLRGESANYRVKAKEAEQRLSDAKTPEEVEAAVAEFKTANADLERQVLVMKAANKHKLPDELAGLLQGTTAEELDAHAQKLARFAPADDPEPEHLSGGLTPGDPDAAFDPVAASRQARKRRY
ncbi:hypothetical protein OG474_30505 [Kribbella sp. NBC_01505]|uniref:hypothetical protein n=1 Tax=Kribbella sp. NBC_01505 TaxID=2903580 RepID=UPI00386F2521